MEIEKFILKNEFLYHLTDVRNWNIIKDTGVLFSAKTIVDLSNLDEEDKIRILHTRRPEHQSILSDGILYYLRDQRPISETNLIKCLTEGWTIADFIYLLNSKIFFWPNLSRLWSHYARYSKENPIILKVSTRSMLLLNENAECCRLNSGATRSNSYLDGAPPKRGEGTFLPVANYNRSVGSVAEVTFPECCLLPRSIYIGYNPSGPWHEYIFPQD
jgi:hypothetical protein